MWSYTTATGSCQGQDLEGQPARGINWRSRVPGQLFIEREGLKKNTSLVLEGIKFFCIKATAPTPCRSRLPPRACAFYLPFK